MGCQVSSEALYDECPRLPLPLAEQRELVGVEPLQTAPVADAD